MSLRLLTNSIEHGQWIKIHVWQVYWQNDSEAISAYKEKTELKVTFTVVN